jgi:hypothetical protein
MIKKEEIDQIIIAADLDSIKNAEIFAVAKDENVSVARSRMVIDNLFDGSL